MALASLPHSIEEYLDSDELDKSKMNVGGSESDGDLDISEVDEDDERSALSGLTDEDVAGNIVAGQDGDNKLAALELETNLFKWEMFRLFSSHAPKVYGAEKEMIGWGSSVFLLAKPLSNDATFCTAEGFLTHVRSEARKGAIIEEGEGTDKKKMVVVHLSIGRKKEAEDAIPSDWLKRKYCDAVAQELAIRCLEENSPATPGEKLSRGQQRQNILNEGIQAGTYIDHLFDWDISDTYKGLAAAAP